MEATPCIKVQVHTKYIPEQSQPTANRYVFATSLRSKTSALRPYNLSVDAG